ncbi:hypothetical protein D5R81_18510 [Parashewanella spongiae]|uniref:Uncharacterized protein n=1 Tax=Parashewanella spongiae TaxID=342950 RepID=A0A3A6T3W2_9GAMM|nr:hypothetical protein [Parashewanella spongiae]MCL1080020.1 hypothetical protein [Parashewanella spongiae]RJY05746.1 hypothetical protein D5R81_18510 [Parashewanella spongiae]
MKLKLVPLGYKEPLRTFYRCSEILNELQLHAKYATGGECTSKHKEAQDKFYEFKSEKLVDLFQVESVWLDNLSHYCKQMMTYFIKYNGSTERNSTAAINEASALISHRELLQPQDLISDIFNQPE